MSHQLRAYWQLAMLWPQMAYAYRLNLVFWLGGTLMQIYLLRVVWTAIYAGRGEVDGVPLEQLVAYLTLANLQLFITYPILAEVLQGRIREGQIAIDLARPVPFLGQLLAQQVGMTLGLLPFVVVAMPFAYLLGNLSLPPTPTAALLYAASFALSYLITTELGLALGLLAFWTMETWAFVVVFRFVNQFFAGALVPLWLFPDWLHLVAGLLPFQTQAHVPLSIYMGQMSGAAALQGLATQALWAVALYGLALLVWRSAMVKVVVQGG